MMPPASSVLTLRGIERPLLASWIHWSVLPWPLSIRLWAWSLILDYHYPQYERESRVVDETLYRVQEVTDLGDFLEKTFPTLDFERPSFDSFDEDDKPTC